MAKIGFSLGGRSLVLAGEGYSQGKASAGTARSTSKQRRRTWQRNSDSSQANAGETMVLKELTTDQLLFAL